MKIDENGVLYEIEPKDVVDGTLVIPDKVKKIDWGNVFVGKSDAPLQLGENRERDRNLAFVSSMVKNIKLPNTLTELCDGCFREFDKLEKLIIPDSVTKIGEGCFEYCKNMKQIRLSRKLEQLPAKSFIGCKLDHLIIPDSVSYIDKEAFAQTLGDPRTIYSVINYLRFPQKMDNADISLLNNVGADQGKKKIILPKVVEKLFLKRKKPDDEIVMPNKFEYDEDIAKLIGNDSSKFKFRNKIGSKIFEKFINNLKNENAPIGRKQKEMSDVGEDETQLTELVIKDVDVIGEFAYAECQNLEVVKIEEGVKSIERGAFAFCPNLKRIELPKSLEYIGSRAFWGCEKLERNSNKI